MIKRFILVLALALMPAAAMAQQHEHAMGAAKPAAEHMNFARQLIAAKADLKLTNDQVTKLEALAIRMDEHHKQMGQQAAKADAQAAKADAQAAHDDAAKSEGKMHADLLAIFNEEQLVKVRPLMKAHMDAMKHMKPTEHKH
jgi:hypothetical protein